MPDAPSPNGKLPAPPHASVLAAQNAQLMRKVATLTGEVARLQEVIESMGASFASVRQIGCYLLKRAVGEGGTLEVTGKELDEFAQIPLLCGDLKDAEGKSTDRFRLGLGKPLSLVKDARGNPTGTAEDQRAELEAGIDPVTGQPYEPGDSPAERAAAKEAARAAAVPAGDAPAAPVPEDEADVPAWARKGNRTVIGPDGPPGP